MSKVKGKKYNRNKLAQKACALIQKYARLRDTDEHGNGYCSSCGVPVTYWNADGGHFHPKTRGYNGACCMEENVNIQCKSCNLFKQGNIAHYAVHLQNKYGRDIIDKIKAQANKSIDALEFLDIIEELKEKIEQIKKTKMFPL